MSAVLDELSAALVRLDVPLGVAESQGLACGLLCSRPAMKAKSRWFSELLDAASLDPDVVSARARDLHTLDAWFEAELAALNDAELDFSLALPEDDEPLDRRLVALGEFCAGFVYGIGIGAAARGDPTLPSDTRELLEDFMAIDGVDTGREATSPSASGEGDADEENAFVELAEYVRMGVLLVNEELKPVAAAPGAPPPSDGPNAGGSSTGTGTASRRLH